MNLLKIFQNIFKKKEKENNNHITKNYYDNFRDREKYIGQKILNIKSDNKPESYNIKKYNIENITIENIHYNINLQIGKNYINYSYNTLFNFSTYTTKSPKEISNSLFCSKKWKSLNSLFENIIGATVTNIVMIELPATEDPYRPYMDGFHTPLVSNAVDSLEIYLDNGKKIVIHHTKWKSTIKVVDTD